MEVAIEASLLIDMQIQCGHYTLPVYTLRSIGLSLDVKKTGGQQSR